MHVKNIKELEGGKTKMSLITTYALPTNPRFIYSKPIFQKLADTLTQ